MFKIVLKKNITHVLHKIVKAHNEKHAPLIPSGKSIRVIEDDLDEGHVGDNPHSHERERNPKTRSIHEEFFYIKFAEFEKYFDRFHNCVISSPNGFKASNATPVDQGNSDREHNNVGHLNEKTVDERGVQTHRLNHFRREIEDVRKWKVLKDDKPFFREEIDGEDHAGEDGEDAEVNEGESIGIRNPKSKEADYGNETEIDDISSDERENDNRNFPNGEWNASEKDEEEGSEDEESECGSKCVSTRFMNETEEQIIQWFEEEVGEIAAVDIIRDVKTNSREGET